MDETPDSRIAPISGPQRGAFEWGLASVGVGGVAVVSATPAFFAGLDIIPAGNFWDVFENYAVLALLGPPALMNLTALAAVTFGIRSAWLARRSGHTAALAAAGVLLGILGVLLWSGVAAAWYFQYRAIWT